VLVGGAIQIARNDAGLDNGVEILRAHLQDAVHPHHVDDDFAVRRNAGAGFAGSTAARDERDAKIIGLARNDGHFFDGQRLYDRRGAAIGEAGFVAARGFYGVIVGANAVTERLTDARKKGIEGAIHARILLFWRRLDKA
jgi:hypothetical protein